MAVSTAFHAPTGSSATDGIAGASMSHVPNKKEGTHSTRWPTTSRAIQPSHGAGLSQASSGTWTTRSVNCPAIFLYRSAISLMGLLTMAQRRTHRRRQEVGPASEKFLRLKRAERAERDSCGTSHG